MTSNNVFGYGPSVNSISPVAGNLDVLGNLHVYGTSQLDGLVTTNGGIEYTSALRNLISTKAITADIGIPNLPQLVPFSSSPVAGTNIGTWSLGGGTWTCSSNGFYIITFNMTNYTQLNPPSTSGVVGISIYVNGAFPSVSANNICYFSDWVLPFSSGTSCSYMTILNAGDFVSFRFGISDDPLDQMTATARFSADIVKLF